MKQAPRNSKIISINTGAALEAAQAHSQAAQKACTHGTCHMFIVAGAGAAFFTLLTHAGALKPTGPPNPSPAQPIRSTGIPPSATPETFIKMEAGATQQAPVQPEI